MLLTPLQARSVLPQYQAADASDIQVSSSLFSGMEFCIMNGDDEHSKLELEKLVYQYGGTCVQYPTDRTHRIIAGRKGNSLSFRFHCD
jgi:hypothetical protein